MTFSLFLGASLSCGGTIIEIGMRFEWQLKGAQTFGTCISGSLEEASGEAFRIRIVDNLLAVPAGFYFHSRVHHCLTQYA